MAFDALNHVCIYTCTHSFFPKEGIKKGQICLFPKAAVKISFVPPRHSPPCMPLRWLCSLCFGVRHKRAGLSEVMGHQKSPPAAGTEVSTEELALQGQGQVQEEGVWSVSGQVPHRCESPGQQRGEKAGLAERRAYIKAWRHDKA